MKMYGEKHLEDLKKEGAFWKTQPVPKSSEIIEGKISEVHGQIETKTIDQIRKDPYKLPEGYYWDVIDMDNEQHLEELYHHLYDHYVEDDDGYFRFNYGKDFIRWALTPPGYEKDMLICIRSNETKHVVSFIAGIIINLRVVLPLTKSSKTPRLKLPKSTFCACIRT
jgi:glycylpeptide N-tetradecanoyltransferase